MEKLQPLVRHRFWILLALVPPLVVFGYYKANGALKAATEERAKALDAAFNAIPTGTGANPKWVDAEHGGLEKYNAELKKAVDAEMVRVWTDQQERMVWPPAMQEYVPDKYRGEFPDEASFTYKAGYLDQIKQLHQSLEPLTFQRGGTITGKVDFSIEYIPQHEFGQFTIPSEDIWDAQEDIWYLQLLFDAVRNVNRLAENAAKAPVRRIYFVELRGGTGESTVQAAAGMAGAAGEMAGVPMPGKMMPSEMMDDRSPGFGLGQGFGGVGQISVSFDPAEEFGTDIESMGAVGAAGAEAAAFAGVDPAAMAGPGMDRLAGALGRMAPGAKPIRYIKFEEGAKIRERGFYMSVLIDQKKIADFLVELSNADWPIRIVRFHVGPNPEAGGSSGYGSPLLGGFGPAGGMAGAVNDLEMRGMGGRLARGGGRPTPAARRPTATPRVDLLAPDAFEDPALMATASPIGATPMMPADQIGDLFTHPDLVQLDVCGIITFFNPPPDELLAAVLGTATEGDAATGETPNADTTPSTETDVPQADAAGTSDVLDAPLDALAPTTDVPAFGAPADGAAPPDDSADPGAGAANPESPEPPASSEPPAEEAAPGSGQPPSGG